MVSKNGHGGKRKGSGRTPDWLKAEAEKIGNPVELIQLYWDVAKGNGKFSKAEIKDRLKASELYLDRVIGKVSQGVEHSGPGGEPIEWSVVDYSKATAA